MCSMHERKRGTQTEIFREIESVVGIILRLNWLNVSHSFIWPGLKIDTALKKYIFFLLKFLEIVLSNTLFLSFLFKLITLFKDDEMFKSKTVKVLLFYLI